MHVGGHGAKRFVAYVWQQVVVHHVAGTEWMAARESELLPGTYVLSPLMFCAKQPGHSGRTNVPASQNINLFRRSNALFLALKEVRRFDQLFNCYEALARHRSVPPCRPAAVALCEVKEPKRTRHWRDELRYLSRYTHRVAISNRRLVAADDDGIAFRWKDWLERRNPLK
jgi:hypothetical protein